MAHGNSPYARPTFRESPITAYIYLLNIFVDPKGAKFAFCILDVVTGLLMWSLLESQNQYWNFIFAYICFWTLNPTTVYASVNGSSHNLTALLVLATVFFLLKKDYVKAGVVYGLSLHFKPFTGIYAIVLYLYIDLDKAAVIAEGKAPSILSNMVPTGNRVKFLALSAASFITLTSIFCFLYGRQFINEAYLHGFTHWESRHNYSIYFSLIQQSQDKVDRDVFLQFLVYGP